MREEKAYRAMLHFLDDRYQRLPTEELGNLLSDLSLEIWDHGMPGDPAVVEDWHAAVARAEQDTTVDSGASALRKAN